MSFTMLDVIKIYTVNIPMCIGLMVWHTITLRPIEGMFQIAWYLQAQFFRKVAIYREDEVVHLYNSEPQLLESMKSYIKENEN